MSWTTRHRPSVLREQAIMFLLMGLIVFVFGLQLITPYDLQAHFMANTQKVVEGWNQLRSGNFDGSTFWSFCTLITCSFMHADLGHILGNLLFYWGFGALINQLLGWRWLLGIVLFTALGSSVTHIIMEADTPGTLVGASGVVYGFMGAYLGLSVRWRLPDPHIWPIARPIPPANLAILALVYVFLNYRDLLFGPETNVSYGGHVGGFTAGLFLACFITPRPAQALSKR